MLFIISPAKTLDFDSASLMEEYTQPSFQTESKELVDIMRGYSSTDLKSMMKVSDKIADLNVERFQEWQLPFTPQNAKQAVYAFKGDVYTGLSVETLKQEAVVYLQDRLRILSGLYGLLKPLDLMQAYRLEMGTKLGHPSFPTLYKFWDTKITDKLNQDLQAHDCLVNLASNEYFNSVQPKQLTKPVITPVFKDQKNGQYKIISFYAKKARGFMVRYAADYLLTDVQDLKAFNYEGYKFAPKESSETTWVFKRQEQ